MIGTKRRLKKFILWKLVKLTYKYKKKYFQSAENQHKILNLNLYKKKVQLNHEEEIKVYYLLEKAKI